MKKNPATTASASTRKAIEKALADGQDENNPTFLFSTATTTLLLAIAAGLIDPVEIAKASLACRGLDAEGDWVGFEAAERAHGVAFDGNKIVKK